MSRTYIDPSAEQFTKFEEMDFEGVVVMLNLLRFDPDGGKERYSDYIKAATPFLKKAGASMRFVGDVAATFIGGDEWDEVILVEYPSRQALLSMIGDPEYPHEMRESSLIDSRLYCMRERQEELAEET